MELEELERNLFAMFCGTTDAPETAANGKTLAKLAEIALANPANEHITEAELKAFRYDEKALTRYFIHEGWTKRSSIELARGMIERGSYLPPHGHLKYLECESEEQKQ